MGRAPPELLAAGTIELHRARPGHAAALASAVAASLDLLRPWMPWASSPSATDESAQRDRLEEALASWSEGTEYGYVMIEPASEEIVGACSLIRRVGPGGIEIGYWVHGDHGGKGYATAAAQALTDAAWTLDDVARVEIHCDEANLRSVAVPERLGFRLDRVEEQQPEAPAECGRPMIWIAELP